MKDAITCEAYVLNALAEAKEEIEMDNEIINKQFSIMGQLMDVLEVVKKNLKVSDSSNGKKVITMEYIFEAYSPEDFAKLNTFFFGKEEEKEGQEE